MLALAVAAYFGIRFVEFALSIVFKDIKAALGISTAVIGIAVTASTITYAAAQLPSGMLGDRYGHRSVILASLGLTGIASLLIAAAPSGLAVVLGMALVGLVSGAYYSPATALLTDVFEGTGRAIGIHRIGAQAVGITGPLVAAAAALYGWRSLLVVSGLLTIPVLVGFRTIVRPRTPAAPDTALREAFVPGKIRNLLSDPRIAATTVVACLAQFVDTATFSFLPLLLREYHELDIGLAGTLFTVYFVAVAISQPVAGWLSDRMGRDPVTACTLSSASIGFLLLSIRPQTLGIGAGVVLVGFGMGWGPPVQAQIMECLDGDDRGTGFGLVRTIYIGFAALAGLLVGSVETVWGWTAGIGLFILLLGTAIVVLGARAGSSRFL